MTFDVNSALLGWLVGQLIVWAFLWIVNSRLQKRLARRRRLMDAMKEANENALEARKRGDQNAVEENNAAFWALNAEFDAEVAEDRGRKA